MPLTTKVDERQTSRVYERYSRTILPMLRPNVSNVLEYQGDWDA